MSTRSSYQGFNEALIDDYRANKGKVSSGPFVDRPLLLLTTRGARSGREYTTPLAYSRDGDRLVIVASKGGAPTNPAWYHNLIANPRVTIELGPETFEVIATPVHGAERRRLYDGHAEVLPVFADYERKTSREIPVIVLERIAG